LYNSFHNEWFLETIAKKCIVEKIYEGDSNSLNKNME
jgi:hypothetical protein